MGTLPRRNSQMKVSLLVTTRNKVFNDEKSSLKYVDKSFNDKQISLLVGWNMSHR